MQRTIDFTSPRGVLVVLIGLLLVLAAPTIAQARGTARGAEADSSLIAAGAGYGSPQGSVRVGAVQHRLVRAGERPGPVDGLYGPLTQDAVERFQAGEGLAVDGIVGPQTARALSRQTTLVSDGAGYSRPDGSTRVRGLQHRLRRAGDRPGTLDGRFGPRTQGAVERFQVSHGLAVDGIVGPVTSERLARFAAVSEHASSGRSRQQGERASAKPGSTPKPSQAPARTANPAPARTVDQGPAEPSSNPGGDHSGFGVSAWLIAVAFAIAGLLGAVLVRTLVRRRTEEDEEEPDPQATEPEPSFQVEFHGRDGKSVMTAAEILSVAALVEGRDALAFPRFRSGPMGPRVVALCRIAGRPLRPREQIGQPDGLIVQDPEASQLSDLCDGLKPDGYLLVNSTRSLKELGFDQVASTLRPDRRLSIPASEIAREHIGLPLTDPVLVGGFAALSGCVSLASVANSIRERFPGEAGDVDVAAAEAGFNYVQSEIRGLGRVNPHPRPAAVGRVVGKRGAA